MTISTKRRMLLSLLLTLAALIILSTSLFDLELLPGQPAPSAVETDNQLFAEFGLDYVIEYPETYVEGIIALFLMNVLVMVFV